MVLMFAILKFFSANPENVMHKSLARFFFAGMHTLMIALLFRTSGSVEQSMLPSKEKLEAKKALRKLLNARLVTAVVIIAIHWKTGILPPLYGSCIMGLFSLFENDHIYSSTGVSKYFS